MGRLTEGGTIDRTASVEFFFNGKQLAGYAGDTLASALLANGIHLVGRSFKYHRPRGIVTAGGEEPNALVQINGEHGEPNVRATTLALSPGLDVSSINCWPGPNFDLRAINSGLAAFIPAGFYYKTFMAGGWDRYAPHIRKAAGLGVVPPTPARRHYEKRYMHTDTLVVGAGASGLEAALAAAARDEQVLLLDQHAMPGGRLLDSKSEAENHWLQHTVATLDAADNITRLARTTVTGYYDHNLLVACEASPVDAPWIHERLLHIRAERVVLATGAVERPLVFANNDRPGIMLASALRTYVNRFAVVPGERVAFFTNNSSAYGAAFDLADAGINVSAIIDSRAEPGPELRKACAKRNIRIDTGSVVINTRGRRRLTGAVVAPTDNLTSTRIESCDVLGVSGGFNPLVHLHSQSGARPQYDAQLKTFVPGPSVQNETSVGAAAGSFEDPRIPYAIDALWDVATPTPRAKAFVDFQNDVTTADLELALRENFKSIEHVKRYTTTGMATDQGKMGNANAIGIVASRLAEAPGDIGTTTYRPPFAPLSFGALAGSDRGALILPARTTPITTWNIERGAAMNEAGANFRRPFWFPLPGESTADAIAREATAVRTSAGIYDATPLGKFELHGPDVGTLLNRVYTNRFDNLKTGFGRFGLMLRDDGRLLDDGVTFRLEDHWLMTCGTGAAPGVLSHIERLLQTEWTDLQVYVVNVTSGWANICVCGPKARDVLKAAEISIDVDTDFKFMQMRDAKVAGFDVRVARVSYTGELSFELNIRRRHARALWEKLVAAGAPWDITPVGSETSGVLRIEKGFISAGSEGDNITNPYDAGLGWIIDMNKGDFIGRRSLQRDINANIPRQHVVGLLPDDTDYLVAEGSALLPETTTTGEPSSRDFQGHVTASCYSPTLGRTIALALLKNGKHRHGERVTVSGLARSVTAEVTAPVFYDPKGSRMRS